MAVIWAKAVAHPIAFWLRCFWAFAAFTQCCAGHGQSRLWLIAAAMPPVALLFLEPQYRKRQWSAVRNLWQSPTATERTAWSFASVFVGLPALALYVSAAYSVIDSGDCWPVVPTAISLVSQGDMELSEFVQVAPKQYLADHPEFAGLPYCLKPTTNGIYSRYPVGMTVFAIPVVAIGFLGGFDTANIDAIATVDRFVACLVAVSVLIVFTRLALLLAKPKSAVAAALLLAAGSAMYTTVAQTCWQHSGVALGVLLILLVELHPRLRNSRWSWLLVSLSIGLMYSCRLSSGAIAVVLLLWSTSQSWRRGIGFVLAAALGVLPVALWYWLVYSTPFGPSQTQFGKESWSSSWIEGLAGVLASPARGLLWYQLWVPIAVVGFVLSYRRNWVWVSVLCSLVQIAIVSRWNCWWGGSCWGSRLLTECLPLLALGLLPVFDWCGKKRWSLWAFAALLILCSLPHLTGVYFFKVSANWPDSPATNFWSQPDWSALLR